MIRADCWHQLLGGQASSWVCDRPPWSQMLLSRTIPLPLQPHHSEKSNLSPLRQTTVTSACLKRSLQIYRTQDEAVRVSDYDPKTISNGIIRFSLLWRSPSLPPQALLDGWRTADGQSTHENTTAQQHTWNECASADPWCLNLLLCHVNWKNWEMSICCRMAMAPSLTGCELLVEGPPCSLSAQCLPPWGSDHGWSYLWLLKQYW